MAAGNVIENPDFQVVSGSSPQNWYGFGSSSISIAPGVKFNGKNCCLCTKRKHPYSAIGQNVVYAVQNGQLFTVITTLVLSVYFVFRSSFLEFGNGRDVSMETTKYKLQRDGNLIFLMTARNEFGAVSFFHSTTQQFQFGINTAV